MWSEALTPWQFSRLFFNAASLARAPRGKGEKVLVWPGFGAGNASTTVLRNFLGYLGYDARGWQLGRNDGDVLSMLDELSDAVRQTAKNEQISLVGWSLGGYLAREVARDCPDLVRRVVTLGSPVVGGPKYTAGARYFDTGTESLDDIERLVDERYENPLTVPVTAIYSKLDGVVAWQACIDNRSPNVEHVAVTSSHTGLGFSPDAFRIMADRLARPH